MGKTLQKILIITLTALVFCSIYSCSKDAAGDMPPITYTNTYGEITAMGDNGYFEITRDDGALLRVLEYTGTKEVSLNERVWFKYQILPGRGDYQSEYTTTNQPVHDVRILVFNNVHSVPVIRQTYLDEDAPHRNDALGNDLIRVKAAAFSGSYINIEFEYFRLEGGVEHMINLVWDDTRDPLDTVHLVLRHNAMGEVNSTLTSPLVTAEGVASFKLLEMIPEGKFSINVRLESNMDRKEGVGEYIETTKYYEGTLNLTSRTKVYIAGSDMIPPVNNNTTFVK